MTSKAQNMNLRIHPHRHLWALIALFGIMISGVSVDLNVPSLPAIAKDFNVNKSFAQLTVTAYLLGFGFFQLFAGSICDSIGRKRPFLIAICIYILTNLLSPFSQDIYQLLGLRFLQGIAVAFCAVAMRAIIPDLFEGSAFKRMANYMTMAWSIGPIIAPAIGGYLQAYFDWPGPFYFLAVYGLILFVLVGAGLPETVPKFTTFKFSKILSDITCMISNKSYLLCMLYTGLLYSMLVLFSVAGPFLIQNVLGYSAIDFGHMALLMGLAWFLGNLSNRFIIDLSPMIKITVCLWLMVIVGSIMLFGAFYFKMTIYTIVTPVFALGYLAAIIFPNYYAKSMLLFPRMSGSANALMASSMVLIGALTTALVSLLKSSTFFPLALVYMGLIVVCLIVYYFTGRASSLEEA